MWNTEELQLVKGNTNKHKHGARFWVLDIKSRDGKFKVGLFDKKDSFPFYIIRMIDESSSLLSNIINKFIVKLVLNHSELLEQLTTQTRSPQKLNYSLPF